MGAPQYEQAGADIGGTGTTNTIPRWTGPSTLGDSGLIDNGTQLYTSSRLFSVGTSNARGSRLSIEQTGTITKMATFSNAVDADFEIRSKAAGILTIGTDTGTLAIQSGGAEAIRVLTTGNVGIGTASPTQRATIEGVGQTVGGTFKYNTNIIAAQSGGDAYKGLLLGYDTASNTGVIGGSTSSAASNLAFWTYTGSAWGERARIDSAGNFGIKQSSPSSFANGIRDLVVGANDGVNNYGITVAGTTQATLAFASGTSGGQAYAGFVQYTHSTSRLDLGAGSSARVGVITTGLDVSTAGYGLKLPATPGNTDPNTLDAYVDGGTAGGGGKTWTPADTSGAGLTLTVNSAQYVQVGKLVVMTADITYPVTASAAVAALSLPVSPAVNYFHAGSTGYQTTPAIAGLAPMVKNTAMNMWAYDTQQTNAQLSGKRLIFTVSYFMG